LRSACLTRGLYPRSCFSVGIGSRADTSNQVAKLRPQEIFSGSDRFTHLNGSGLVASSASFAASSVGGAEFVIDVGKFYPLTARGQCGSVAVMFDLLPLVCGPATESVGPDLGSFPDVQIVLQPGCCVSSDFVIWFGEIAHDNTAFPMHLQLTCRQRRHLPASS